MSTRTGLPRAEALARGTTPPRPGSFEDALLCEVDERQRNLRFAEMSLVMKALVLLLDGTAKHAALIDEWMRLYEAHLYGDLYTPEWELEQRRTLQRKRREERAATEDKQRLLEKLENFSR